MILEFLRQNAEAVSALAGIGSFFIWSVYAILFYNEYRRRRASHLFIHAAGDGSSATRCLVINMSPEPVHILCSLATCGDNKAAMQIQAPTDEDLPIQAITKQGPLESGASLSLGSFQAIMEETMSGIGLPNKNEQDEHNLEIRVAAIHGLSDEPVGALRRFSYNLHEEKIIPSMAHTKQMRTRRHSRQVKGWMEDCKSYRKPNRTEAPE